MSQESPSHLEDRLQALLDSSGLDLPARSDATGLVVGRVRRARRRRRVVQATVPALLTVVAIATGMTVFYHHDKPPAPASPTVLTASGIGDLRLGMTVAEAQAARLIGKRINEGAVKTCAQYLGTGDVEQVSANNDGVIAKITIDAFANSPEGIFIGQTYADLQARYGDRLGKVNQSSSPATVRVALGNGSSRYTFEFETSDMQRVTAETKISGMSLSRTTDTCA